MNENGAGLSGNMREMHKASARSSYLQPVARSASLLIVRSIGKRLFSTSPRNRTFPLRPPSGTAMGRAFEDEAHDSGLVRVAFARRRGVLRL